jgi:PEP-CTERM motif
VSDWAIVAASDPRSGVVIEEGATRNGHRQIRARGKNSRVAVKLDKRRRDCAPQDRCRKGNPKEIWAKQQFARDSFDYAVGKCPSGFIPGDYGFVTITESAITTPEPSTLWLLGAGCVGGLLALLWSRKNIERRTRSHHSHHFHRYAGNGPGTVKLFLGIVEWELKLQQ